MSRRPISELPVPDAASDRADAESLRSRTDARRAERELEDTLARLAKALVDLSPRQLEKLELPEPVLDSLLDTQAIASHAARNRQLRVVRAALRESDWSLVRARLDSLLKHGSIPPNLSGSAGSARARAPEWVARLLGEGSPAIEELLRIAPNGDRVHLANLIRLVKKNEGDRRARAEERLSAAVQSLLR